MRPLASSLLLLCSLLLVLGCPKKDEPDQPNSSGNDGGISGQDASQPDSHRPATVAEYDAFWNEAASVYCERMRDCGVMEEALLAHCKAALLLETDSAQTRASIAAGYQLFYVDAAARCLAALKSMQCTQASFGALDQSCDDLQEGAQGKDQPCYDSDDCRGGLSCAGTGCEKKCSDHQGTIAPGGSCASSDATCDETLGYCGASKTCVAWLAEGEDCSGSGVCNTKSLFCDPDTSKCRPQLASGAACDVYSWGECADGLFCKPNSSGSEDGACAARPVEGGSCTSSTDCGNVMVDGYDQQLFCSMSGKCERYSVEIGQACDEEQFCNDGYCNGVSTSAPGTCTAPTFVGADAACSTASPYEKECELGLYCNAQSRTCKPLGGVGAACGDGQGCKEFFECVAGACAAPAALGEACGGAGCVAPNICDPATNKCVSPLANGATCEGSRECASGNCSDAVCAPVCGG